MSAIKIGLIGGSGLGEALTSEATGETFFPDTPFGRPSGPIICTEWDDLPVAILARHGDGHTLGPSYIPFQANIFALKQLGVTHIIASGAVGSLREDIHPGELVIADQVIDKTYKRQSSFFGQGLIAHIEFDQPFCRSLRTWLLEAGKDLPTRVHDAGTYVCMEGPQFSTVAESNMHRSWSGDLIGMTCMPEAKLAREAEICYALIALPTDYDCWRPHPADRPKRELLAEIIANMQKAASIATDLIKRTLKLMAKADPKGHDCPCRSSLELAIWTDRTKIDPAIASKLEPLVGKYLTKTNDTTGQQP